MKNLVVCIGSMVIGFILLLFPVLLTVSFIYNWDAFFKFIFIITVILEYMWVVSTVSTWCDN